MENLRAIQEHKYFGLKDGQITDKDQVAHGLVFLSEGNRMLHYRLLLHDQAAGHGLLLWCVQARGVKEELIEVFPDTFCLWGLHFKTLKDLIEWFKETGWRNRNKCRKDFREEPERGKVFESMRCHGMCKHVLKSLQQKTIDKYIVNPAVRVFANGLRVFRVLSKALFETAEDVLFLSYYILISISVKASAGLLEPRGVSKEKREYPRKAWAACRSRRRTPQKENVQERNMQPSWSEDSDKIFLAQHTKKTI